MPPWRQEKKQNQAAESQAAAAANQAAAALHLNHPGAGGAMGPMGVAGMMMGGAASGAGAAAAAGPCKLHVGGLHVDISERDFKAVFEPFGQGCGVLLVPVPGPRPHSIQFNSIHFTYISRLFSHVFARSSRSLWA